MRTIEKNSYSQLEQLPQNLKETVEELTGPMPEGSWAIQETASDRYRRTPFFSIPIFLRDSANVINDILGGEKNASLRIIDTKTMALGLYPEGRTVPAIRYGLFSYPKNDRYDPEVVKKALNGYSRDVVLPGRVNLREVTGRGEGTISPILGKDHLKNFAVVDINQPLVDSITVPNGAVAYALGTEKLLYFCARGNDFLAAYQKLLSNLGVSFNLGNIKGSTNL